MKAMTLKDDLLPTGKNRVIDLVRAAGVNVSDWSHFKRGSQWAASNPKYCYEWSFVEPGKVVVLNLWYANVNERSGGVTVVTNMREASKQLVTKGSKALWIKRAEKMDEAIQIAVRDSLKVRVIINDGEMRDSNNPSAKASVVKHRHLDPIPWTIKSYDTTTGQCILVRGGAAVTSIDQFDVAPPSTPDPEQVDVHGKAFVRSATVRAAVLARAKGRCEYCGKPGFATTIGEVFLETHHIIPLSKGGKDMISNAAAVCPNHHREAHHGAKAALIRDNLLEVAAISMMKKVV
jgi:5-methylcytosine-specific restriction enzyme A